MTPDINTQPAISPDDLILKGLQFSVKAHRGQVRKVDGQPYFFHPLAVGRLLMEIGCTVEVVVAGFLHDVVEDTPYTIKDIGLDFGSQIAGWVNAVTEQDKSKPWQVRKQATLDVLAKAESEVIDISLADKSDNLRSMRVAQSLQGPEIWDRLNRPKPDQCWYYQNLLSIFSRRVTSPGGKLLLQDLHTDFSAIFDQ
jgi:(p)ppGpp synthase/HD superfamily hydrolase